MRDGIDMDRRFFEVRYLRFAKDISRKNNFFSNWGPEILFFIIWFLVTTILFLRKDIVADGAIFSLSRKPPFLKLDKNEIEDYDQHDINKETLNYEEQSFYKNIQTVKTDSGLDDVKASLFKLNPNAILILIIYVFYFFGFFAIYLSGGMGMTTSVVCFVILVFVPVFVQNTNNPRFKMKISDRGALIFSIRGIDCKAYFCPLADIESAVVYLESFNGFIYRDRTTVGFAKTKMNGDNNKISFRSDGEVSDFTFILESAKDYWAFKNLMTFWSEKGVNVFLQKVFEDEFIIQEMTHFHEIQPPTH
jgi:hypothetical protein